MNIEQIAKIAVEEYDDGTLKPSMAKRIAARTLIEDATATLLVEAIDAYVDKHSEDQEYGN